MLIGTVINPYLRPLELNMIQLAKKIEAGADFIQTQPVFDVEEFTVWLDAARKEGLADKTAILAGVLPLTSAEEAEKLREAHTELRIPDAMVAKTQGRRQRGRPGEGRLEALRRDHRQAQGHEGCPGHSHPLGGPGEARVETACGRRPVGSRRPMPEKYHIETKPVPPRRPRIGKFGVVDWREDCARCHNCVKKACVYDRYRQEAEYIRTLEAVDALFFECMGCFSCVQNCTKGLLWLSVNPVYEALGNSYWTPDIIHTTWTQAETAKIPVSGAGYRGRFSGPGFDCMWTDMSEIVRPTRDGIHGREYISTAVDIGRKPAYLTFEDKSFRIDASCLSIPMPLILDLPSPRHTLPKLGSALREAAVRTDIIALAGPSDLALRWGRHRSCAAPHGVLPESGAAGRPAASRWLRPGSWKSMTAPT